MSEYRIVRITNRDGILKREYLSSRFESELEATKIANELLKVCHRYVIRYEVVSE